MSEIMRDIREKLGTLADLRAAVALLQWDQEVNMPPKGAPARAQQLATLSAAAHRAQTDPGLGALLEQARERGGLSQDEHCLVREARVDYDRAVKLPEDFVHAFAEAQSAAFHAWTEARDKADYALFQPHLTKLLKLLRRKADLIGYEESPYDALLDEFERGMTAAQLKPLFAELAEKQRALVARIGQVEPPNRDWLEQTWDKTAQWEFTLRVVEDLGYDLDAGRQDLAHHPFTTNFDLADVRITTRVNPTDLFSALTASIHECGHALYEQGFSPEDRRTVLAEAPSLGIHESQSRMWENMIGRSLPFWRHYAPALRKQFPGQLDDLPADSIWRAINCVEPSLIRVEADECTYNLHVILRFEIELALIEGDLDPAAVPAAWNEKVKHYLGLDVPNDALGCLQDIHWSHGALGYFPTYALGNLYAAQLFEQILRDIPGLWDFIEAGEFSPLRDWLRIHVHRIGRRRLAPQIVRDVTAAEPSPAPFLRYLEHKYGELYAL